VNRARWRVTTRQAYFSGLALRTVRAVAVSRASANFHYDFRHQSSARSVTNDWIDFDNPQLGGGLFWDSIGPLWSCHLVSWLGPKPKLGGRSNE
jgi:hypothetical protein